MRGDRDRIEDMVEMCDLLLEHIDDVSRLEEDPVIQAAAQRWIEILGEAASNVSTALTAAHPEIAWRDIVGTRVILAHAYFNIDQSIIKSVVESEIPQLRRQLHDLLITMTDDDN